MASLFNRYRPRRFAELIGQEATATALRSAVEHGRVASAYLFSGPQGTGKTSAARVLARALNCSAVAHGEPCGECSSCRTDSVDVIEMDAASNRGIDDIRSLREQVMLAPLGDGRRVFILDEAHQITGEAFNALLKTLEEPPAHALFILATTEPEKVPGTIQSRCQHFPFRRVATDALVSHMSRICQDESVSADTPALEALARAGRGGVRDSLVLLEQAANLGAMRVTLREVDAILGTVGEEQLRPIIQAHLAGDLPAAFGVIARLFGSGADGEEVLRELTEIVRADFASAVREKDPTAALLFPLLDELARASELSVQAELAFLPLELALFRAGSGEAGSARGPVPVRPAPASAPSRAASAPAVRSAPSASAPVAAPPSALDLERVRAAWRRLPEELTAQKQLDAAQMCAGSIFPDEVRGDLVTLATDGVLAHNWLKDRTRQEALRRALERGLGAPVRVSVRAAPAAVAPARTGYPAAGAPSVPAPSPEYERFSGQLVRFFEAS